MKKNTVIVLFVLLINPFLKSQNIDFREKIQLKVNEGLSFIIQQTKDNSNDIIIIKTNPNSKCFFVHSIEQDIVKAKEVIIPHHSRYKEEIVEIRIDSIIDVFWIKKNRFQNLVLTNFENPFKLNKRFQNDIISTIQNEIKDLERQKFLYFKEIEAQDYYKKIKEKYSDLEFMNFDRIQEGFSKSTNSSIVIGSSVIYPQMARVTETQGVVRIGFVLTQDCQAEDFFVFKDLPHGCTESVIRAVKEASKKLIEQSIICQKNYYIEGDFYFVLQ